MQRTILLVDDSDAVRMTFAALLESDGHHVLEARNLTEARDQLVHAALDAAVVDLHLPDGLGTTLFEDVRARHPHAAIVLLSGSGAASSGDADLVLEKGQDLADLGDRIEAAIAARAAA
jgi:two-component system response regulator PilR (NtrC family)